MVEQRIVAPYITVQLRLVTKYARLSIIGKTDVLKISSNRDERCWGSSP